MAIMELRMEHTGGSKMNEIKERFHSFISEHKQGVGGVILTLLYLAGLELQGFIDSTPSLRGVFDLCIMGWLIAIAFVVCMDGD